MTISAHENPPRYHENPPRYNVVKRHTDQHKRRLRGPLLIQLRRKLSAAGTAALRYKRTEIKAPNF
jgi:hypothetical protein